MPPANPPLPYSRGKGRREYVPAIDHPLLTLTFQMLIVCGLGVLFLFTPLRELAQALYFFLLIPVVVGLIAHFLIIMLPNVTKNGFEDYIILLVMTVSYGWFYAIIVTCYEKYFTCFSMAVSLGIVICTFALAYALPCDVTSWHGTIQMYVSILYGLASVTILLVRLLARHQDYGMAFSILSLVVYTFHLFVHSQLCLLRCGNITRGYYVKRLYKIFKCAHIFSNTFVIFCSMVYIMNFKHE